MAVKRPGGAKYPVGTKYPKFPKAQSTSGLNDVVEEGFGTKYPGFLKLYALDRQIAVYRWIIRKKRNNDSIYRNNFP